MTVYESQVSLWCGIIVTSAKAELVQSVHFVYLFARYTAEVISWFCETVFYDWAYQSENWLTFDGDAVSDTDFGSLFRFPRHCRIGGLLAFLMQSLADFYNTRLNDYHQ